MRLALYARVFDAAHFFLPSIPMLHRSTLYMAGAAMPRGARLSLLRASLAPETRRATCYLSSERPNLFSSAPCAQSDLNTNLYGESRDAPRLIPVPACNPHGAIRRSQVASILGMPPTCPDPVAPGVCPLRGHGPINAPRQRSPGLLGYTGRRRLCPVIGCSWLVLKPVFRTTAAPAKARRIAPTTEVYT